MAYTTIKKPSDYFNTKLYTGDGTDGRGITGVGFQPDWCWFKARSTAYENQVYDVVRGATKRLVTNDNTAEGTQTNGLQSFDSDGFTVGNANATNVNAVTYASWNWLASNTTASNTDGSITSTVSANTTSGFSIVSYTGNGTSGATVGHGLGTAPKVVIVKGRTNVNSWRVQHASLGANYALDMDATSAANLQIGNWNNTAPTSSVFTLGNFAAVNENTINFIAYCFAEKQGYSKFGVYSGNGNADGPFVYTGFKPAFIMIKDADNLENWFMFDSKRPGYNVNANLLYANDSATETTSGANQIDLLSNGFKMRATNNGVNRSGGEGFTYMAFAEEPLVGDNPATAR